MPRIVPLQLLKCLKVLLDDNGGILSAGEVKRIAGLMTKYSKKLVSKCIYVQILKCTKTELLGEFMGVGGWTLVYTWLNDAIRAMNWPLVQEILELLLLCPVDVHRLKINSAPKLVKGLCKDGGNEGVRILAKRLVEQWLKVVTENTAATAAAQQTNTMTPQANTIASTAHTQEHKQNTTSTLNKQQNNTGGDIEQDPLADDSDVMPEPTKYTLTPAQKKANEAGLVYKIMVKDGQQILAKVAKSAQPISAQDDDAAEVVEEDESESVEADHDEVGDISIASRLGAGADEEDTTVSLDKPEKESGGSSGDEESTAAEDKTKTSVVDGKSASADKKSFDIDLEKTDKKERKSSRDSRDGKERDRERRSDKDRERSKSSSHKSSSSSHKSSTSSSKSSSSSKSKSSSSSSSHRSSSDKHRSDKDRSSSSSKDKERRESASSSSSKHKSSSSKSSSSSSSSKERHRDKDKDKLNSSSSSSSAQSSKKDKEREKEVQAEKDKDTLAKMTPPSLDKLGKIPKKSKEESDSDSNKPTSITIPSKKASMSIEIRRDSEKAKTVKTYKSQFRSHGLTEEAPPPPSRKGLKKPTTNTPAPGTVIPTSLPSASLKRTSPPPRDSPTEKKAKIDINNVTIANEKPGSIKLIAPKKIQTLVETNIFSDALSAATGPKKTVKRKRPNTPAGKEGPSPPTSPEAVKVAPLKFYQDTLDESKSDEKSDKENDESGSTSASEQNKANNADNTSADKENLTEDDDDIPLKKVKEDIEQKVLREQKETAGDSIDTSSDQEEDKKDIAKTEEADAETVDEPKKPGPGCGPNGPPGVLIVHRRKGPKKKLTWRPQEQLEQIRFFELDETERVNVTKTTSSFMDMKNMERFSERDAINMSRRGFNHDDNMEPQTPWRALIEVDDVPPHPDGNQSKQRKVQSDRELTTLRALYFSHSMIPDSPAEAELEPHFAHDIPVIPLDDITGNPDAVNDFTSMPWPEPKGSPKHGDNSMAGTGGLGGLGGPVDMFSNATVPAAANPFTAFMSPFGAAPSGNMPPQQMPMQMPQNGYGPPHAEMGPMGGPPPNFMGPPHGQFGPGGGQPFVPYGPPNGFNNGPNFGPMGMNGPSPMNGPMNGPGPGPRNNNRSNGGGNWRSGGSNFQDNNGGGGGTGNWRPAGTGPNRGGGNNTGVCKAYMRGHCRLGKSCKYIHPKSKRI